MQIIKSDQIERKKILEDSARDVDIRWVISETDGADNFAMRIISVRPGGHTPYHQHPWEHETFVLKGKGYLVSGGGRHPFEPGDAIFVAPNEFHQFECDGDTELQFICVVPIMKD